MKRDAAKPLADFTIKCSKRSRLFFRVKVWKSKRDMYANGPDQPHTYLACCENYTAVNVHKDGRREMTGECGTLHFYKGRTGTSTVSHEITHAAFSWARRHRISLDSHPESETSVANAEEAFCWVQGWLFGEIAKKFWATGIWV